MLEVEIFTVTYPLHRAFHIARGTPNETVTPIVVRITDAHGNVGYGETVPSRRLGESRESVVSQIESIAQHLARNIPHSALSRYLPAGAARNAVDNALWDLYAKRNNLPVWRAFNMKTLEPLLCTHTTISLGSPEQMAEHAQGLKGILKLKLGGKNPDGSHDGFDGERLEAVRAAAPHARLTADVNEGWGLSELRRYRQLLNTCDVEALEQPVPEGQDGLLLRSNAKPNCPVFADESVHTRDNLLAISGIYEGINIKLEKAGGLTEAMELRQRAKSLGYLIMVGCMAGGSLGTAPAMLVAQGADWVDLDGPRLVSADTNPALRYEGDHLQPLPNNFWGSAQQSEWHFPGEGLKKLALAPA